MSVTTLGFMPIDFAVFRIESFDQRMQKIYAQLLPKLIKLGYDLAPELSRKTCLEFFPHVARHARRTVNPPPETWAAFGPSPRGYKRYGYLALCISSAGLHARAVVKPEADDRLAIARGIKLHAAALAKDFTGTALARYDMWDFARLPAAAPAEPKLFTTLAERLEKKTGGLDIGFGWSLRDSLRLDRAELLDAFGELAPLYRLLRAAA
jgi:uncharacterized protein YktB (UPF0637 family)